MSKSENELLILRILEENPRLTQRELAKKLGLSLGKTNFLIHSLIDKGWVKLSNFKRSDNKLGYIYFLTSEGVAEKTSLARSFIRRKSLEYNELKKEIEILKKEV